MRIAAAAMVCYCYHLCSFKLKAELDSWYEILLTKKDRIAEAQSNLV